MSEILITGMGGFTGRHLASVLAQAGNRLNGLVHNNHSDFVPPRNVKIHSCDLLDLSSVRRVVEETQPDCVVHLAAISFVAHCDIEQIYRTNILGTRNLLQAYSDIRGGKGKVLLASSANVYGNTNVEVLGETVLPAPANDYAVSKLAMEYVANLYRSKLQIIAVRPFNYTGVGQSIQFVIPKLVDAFQRRVPELKLGNIEIERDFSDVRDLVAAYSRLLATDVEGTFNVCSGRSTSLLDIVNHLSCISGHRIEINVDPKLIRSNEVKRLRGDNSRLLDVIGPWSSRPIQETLAWMLSAAR